VEPERTYQVELSKKAEKTLAKLPRKDINRIKTAIDKLAFEPRPPGAKKLVGRDDFRIRVGIYRVIYNIKDNLLLIEVVAIGHRRDIYR